METQKRSSPTRKSGRKPLQPINCIGNPQIKIKKECMEEEKKDGIMVEKTCLDVSLAEELSGMKKRMERLKVERERTEKMFRERDLILDMKIKDIIYHRAQLQKDLEIEVDRLYRLKQLQLSCLVSPIKSLREKQQENNMFKEAKKEDEEREESVGENTPTWTIEETSDSVSITN